MHCHLRTKCGYMLREALTGFFAQSMDPPGERLLHGLEKLLDARFAQLPRQRQGREFGLVQNLVGIGIADAAE